MPSSFLSVSNRAANCGFSLRFLGLPSPNVTSCSATTVAGREESTITLSDSAIASDMSCVTSSAVFFYLVIMSCTSSHTARRV